MYHRYKNISLSSCLLNLITKFNNRFTIHSSRLLNFLGMNVSCHKKEDVGKKVILFQYGFNKAIFFCPNKNQLTFLIGLTYIYLFAFFFFLFLLFYFITIFSFEFIFAKCARFSIQVIKNAFPLTFPAESNLISLYFFSFSLYLYLFYSNLWQIILSHECDIK